MSVLENDARCQFPEERVPSKQIVPYLANKMKTTGQQKDKATQERNAVTGERSNVIGGRLGDQEGLLNHQLAFVKACTQN